MKTLLGSLLVLATFMSSCSAHCYLMPTESSESYPPVCKDVDGTIYPVNSTWKTQYCEDCSCSDSGIECCNIASVPIDYDEKKCHAIFHPENCTYHVVDRKDPGKACAVTTWML
ncbi:PREDICTED: beta-microseminoprotein-like isoform X2 [Chinchilla lanigera]|uniref:Beta-microseminoprotein n=1 Tax=Chinchilla lanigera TaxID=34839 RepID=A0A8C2YI66_CHILA|nr:PREDICTED: beta-microseminoprotein-like isoform X2 [Chinchilla lanigera]